MFTPGVSATSPHGNRARLPRGDPPLRGPECAPPPHPPRLHTRTDWQTTNMVRTQTQRDLCPIKPVSSQVFSRGDNSKAPRPRGVGTGGQDPTREGDFRISVQDFGVRWETFHNCSGTETDNLPHEGHSGHETAPLLR